MRESVMYDDFDVDVRRIITKEGISTNLTRELDRKDLETFELHEELIELKEDLDQKNEELER